MAAMFLLGVAMAATGINPGAAAGVQATTARPAGDERVVCRREEGVGTRLGSRVCLTRAQWRQRDQENREATRALVEDSERDGRTGADLSGEGSRSIAPN